MKNYLTKNEYTGQNWETLASLGFTESDEFVTFKQALKIDGVTGQTMKGLKKCASLMRFRTEEDDDGNKVKKMYFYAVFNVKEVLANRDSEINKAA